MKRLIFAFLLVIFSQALALKCYDEKDKLDDKSCDSTDEVCYVNKEGYGGCGSKDICKDKKGYECKFCTTDKCNKDLSELCLNLSYSSDLELDVEPGSNSHGKPNNQGSKAGTTVTSGINHPKAFVALVVATLSVILI